MKLLIVKDNSVGRLIRSTVANVVDCREGADGAAALLVYTAERPNVVVMDIEMKTMDGITSTRHILATNPFDPGHHRH